MSCLAWLTLALVAIAAAVTPADIAAIKDAYIHCPVEYNATLLDSFSCQCVSLVTGESQYCSGGLIVPPSFVWPAPMFSCGLTDDDQDKVVAFQSPVFGSLACLNLPPFAGMSDLRQVIFSEWSTVSTGTLPTEWGALSLDMALLSSDMTSSAHRMGVSGTLPTEWTGLQEITVARGDRISGTIPPAWLWGQSRTIQLYELPLVSGTLPDVPSTPKTSGLRLTVGATKLSGTLPSKYASISTQLVLDYNYLSGSVPQSLNTRQWAANLLELRGNRFNCPVKQPDDRPFSAMDTCVQCSFWEGSDCSGTPFYSGQMNQGECIPAPSGILVSASCYDSNRLEFSYNATAPVCGVASFPSQSYPQSTTVVSKLGSKCHSLTSKGINFSLKCTCPHRKFGYAWASPLSTVIPLFVFLIWLPLTALAAVVIIFFSAKQSSLGAAIKQHWALAIYQFSWVGIIILFPAYVGYFHAALDYNVGGQVVFHLWIWGNVAALMASAFVVAWLASRPGASRIALAISLVLFVVALLLFIIVPPSVISAHYRSMNNHGRLGLCHDVPYHASGVSSQMCSDHKQGLAGMKAGWVLTWVPLLGLFVASAVVPHVKMVLDKSRPAASEYQTLSSPQ